MIDYDYNDAFDGFDDFQADDFFGYGFSGGHCWYDEYDEYDEMDDIFSDEDDYLNL